MTGELNNDYKKETLIQEIELALINDDLQTSKKLISKYEKNFEKDYMSYCMKGIISTKENNLELALANFEKGIELNDSNFDLHFNNGYVNYILKRKKEAILNYKKCLSLTEDTELKGEVSDFIYKIILDKSDEMEEFIFITININSDDNIFNYLNCPISKNVKILNFEIADDIKVDKCMFDLELQKIEFEIKEILEKNNNVSLIVSDIYIAKYFIKLKEVFKLVYYIKQNFYIDNLNYINKNLNLYIEKQICDEYDLVLTNDISVYNFKTLFERRNNIYFFNEFNDCNLKLDDIIFNIKIMDKSILKENIINRIHKEKDEYKKNLGLIGINNDSIKESLELAKNLYLNYRTYESYLIYLNLLNLNKNFVDALSIIMENNYCDDIFKHELDFLSSINEYNLIQYIIYLSIKNYKKAESTNKSNLDYKIASFNYELNEFDTAYDIYNNLINTEDKLVQSPLVNRNLSYLMYCLGNEKYKVYYKKYVK